MSLVELTILFFQLLFREQLHSSAPVPFPLLHVALSSCSIKRELHYPYSTDYIKTPRPTLQNPPLFSDSPMRTNTDSTSHLAGANGAWLTLLLLLGPDPTLPSGTTCVRS